jgi:hypothetical protein
MNRREYIVRGSGGVNIIRLEMLGVQAGDNLLNGHKKVQVEDISTTPIRPAKPV